MVDWSANQYRKFEAERNRPIVDLLAHIPTDTVGSACDIGCGPGNSTELLIARYPEAQVSGMDSSADMIAAARERLPGVAFEVSDIASWQPQAPLDLILANAALQWVPDHETLFPALIGSLAPGGTLAVQMPDNLEEPSHALMNVAAADGPWKDRLAGGSTARTPRHEAQWYFRLLRDRTTRLDIWRTTYFHRLDGGIEGIVEWLKGTGLRPFLQRLDDDAEREDFLDRYRALLAEAYPVYEDGAVLLPFPRLFILATAS